MNRSALPLGSAREREHGQVLVLFAFVLIGLLLVSALAVDYGGWLLARRTYQNVADEAALAGAAQLTSPIADACTGSQPSKNHCAREAAWTSIKNAIGIPALTPSLQADQIGDAPYDTLDGYHIWVASPPSDAGAAYPGFASSNKTIFVRVERDLQAGLSRIIKSSATTVGSWATAGRIPKNFAILTLCGPPDCEGSNGEDFKVNGNGSTLILLSGDIGSNSFAKTSGSGAAIALSDANGSLAYMHFPSECQISSVSCQLVGWDEATSSRTTPKSALALPQVVDPQYFAPPLSAGATPYQCYSTLDTPPVIASAGQLLARGPNLNHAPVDLTSAVQPAPRPSILLGAAPVKIKGTVTTVVGGIGLTGITVTATGPGGPLTATSAAGGAFTINGATQSSSYSLVATDATNTYHTSATLPITTTTSDFNGASLKMSKNPSFTGSVTDLVTGATIAGATVTFTGTGGPFTATTNAAGVYTIYVTNAATSYSATGSATNYAAQNYPATVSLGLDSASQTLNFTLNPNNGTIKGTVFSGGSGLVGATVTVTGVGSVLTTAGGAYTIGVAAGASYTVTASMTGYTSSSATVGPVGAGATVTQNFVLVASSATMTGTVQDQTNGLPVSGASVTASNGVTSGTVTTNASGVYFISGLSPSNPKYTVTVSYSGYDNASRSNLTVSAGANTVDFLASGNHALWPTHCGNGGSRNGEWDCGTGTGGCPSVTDPTGVDVTCSAYNNANVIRPGTYKSITISNNQCAWIDPLGSHVGLPSGQSPGIVYVTDSLDIGSNAFLFGDGVTIVLGPDAQVSVNNSGGFVLNYQGASGTFLNTWRTKTNIGETGVTTCAGDADGIADLRKGGWGTENRSPWDTSVSPACYRDEPIKPAEIGMTWYMVGTATHSGHRFDLSGQMGFLFDGVLYGPKDDIGLGGQGAQAAAGQIVAWTLTYSGGTNIIQRYSGIEVDGPPYLIEPYLGE
jgi:hypothetical protein